MRSSVVLTTFLFSGLVVHAWADDPPARKPGLWEVVDNMDMAEPASQVYRICVSPESEADALKFNKTLFTGCTRNEARLNDNVLTTDSECSAFDSKITDHALTIYVSEKVFAMDRKIHFDPPLMGRSDAVQTQDGRWLGPCPPEMKPGDLLKSKTAKPDVKSSEQPDRGK